jgi:hypothetical protein
MALIGGLASELASVAAGAGGESSDLFFGRPNNQSTSQLIISQRTKITHRPTTKKNYWHSPFVDKRWKTVVRDGLEPF